MTKILISANTDWYLYNFRLSLASFLRERGADVILVSPPGKYVDRIISEGFRWHEWKVGRQTIDPWKEINSILRLVSLYRQEKPDIVHHHTIKPVLYGSLAARIAGIEAVINSITGLGYVFIRKEFKARLLKIVAELIYKISFYNHNLGVIFENADIKKYFMQKGFIQPERAWIIEGVGVDIEQFIPLPEPKGVPVVLLAARMLWDKGVGILVEASRILSRKVQVRIVLVGVPDLGNPATIDEKTLLKWQNEGIIEWWGWKEDMLEVFGQCHIVTLPTMGEGIPTTLLEAAACGRPLVVSDVPGCHQVVKDGENGFLVPPNDPIALADALERLVSDLKLRGKMGKAGRQLVTERFTNSQVNTATLRVYENVLGESIS